MRKCRFSFLISLWIFLFVLPLSVWAISAEGLSIYPGNEDSQNPLTKSWFIYNLESGVSKNDELIIFNSLKKSVTVEIYPVDSKTNNLGGFALAERNEPRVSVGAWITPEKIEATLPPKKETRIPFTLTVPQGLEPGEYSGGIIVETKDQKPSLENSIQTKTRIGIRVYETVPGEIIEKVSLEKFEAKFYQPRGVHTFVAHLVNEGNISIPVKLTLSMKSLEIGFASTFVSSADFPMFNTEIFIPRNTSIQVPLQFEAPKIGKYEVILEGQYNNTKFFASPIAFWAIPWFELGITLGGLAMLILFFMFDRFMRRRST